MDTLFLWVVLKFNYRVLEWECQDISSANAHKVYDGNCVISVFTYWTSKFTYAVLIA